MNCCHSIILILHVPACLHRCRERERERIHHRTLATVLYINTSGCCFFIWRKWISMRCKLEHKVSYDAVCHVLCVGKGGFSASGLFGSEAVAAGRSGTLRWVIIPEPQRRSEEPPLHRSIVEVRGLPGLQMLKTARLPGWRASLEWSIMAWQWW